MTDEMLDQIAQADYGQEAEKHRVELERIRAGVPREHKLSWVPNEVIQLHAWSEHATTLQKHLTRAFCCAVLLRNDDEHGNRENQDFRRLGPLIMSDGAIPPPYHEKLLGMIVDALTKMEPWDEEYLHYAWALAHILIKNPMPLTKEQVQEVAAWYKRIHPEILSWHRASPMYDPPRPDPEDYSHRLMWTEPDDEPPKRRKGKKTSELKLIWETAKWLWRKAKGRNTPPPWE